MRAFGGLACATLVALTGCAQYVVWREGDVRVVERAGTQRVVASERVFSAHAAIASDAVAASAGHVAYAARDGITWRVFRDGAPEPGTWSGIGAIAIAPDGASVAYAAEREHHWYVVTHGRESPALDEVSAVGFTSRGRVAFVAKREGAIHAYLDGIASAHAWREVRDVSFVPEISFIATDDAGEHLVRSDDASPAFDAILETTADGFVARTLGKTGRIAFAFGKTIGEGEIEHLVTSAGHYAYAELDSAGEVAVHDGVRDSIACVSIDTLTISRDGEHFGYACKTKSAMDVVVDGTSIGTFDWAHAPVFASHGAYAFVASLGAGAFVRSSASPKTNAAFDVVIEDSLALSDDGAHWAVVAGYASVRRLYTIVDGKPVGAFDLDAWVGEELRLGAHMNPARRRMLLAARTREALIARARASR